MMVAELHCRFTGSKNSPMRVSTTVDISVSFIALFPDQIIRTPLLTITKMHVEHRTYVVRRILGLATS